MKLSNEALKGKSIISSHGTLVFDENGVLVEPELTEEQVKSFDGLKGYEITSTSDGKPVKEDNVAKEESDDKVAPKEAEKEETEEEPEPDYDSLTIDELKAKAEELNLNVKGTGRKGSVLKKDYIKALKSE